MCIKGIDHLSTPNVAPIFDKCFQPLRVVAVMVYSRFVGSLTFSAVLLLRLYEEDGAALLGYNNELKKEIRNRLSKSRYYVLWNASLYKRGILVLGFVSFAFASETTPMS